MGRTPGATANYRKMYVPLMWMDDALCRQTDTELFFPEQGKASTFRRAVAICRACPVMAQCLAWAVDDPSLCGVLGGTSERERMQMRKMRRLHP